MDRLWPLADPHQPTEAELESGYAYPDSLTRPWVAVNFVSSADGAVSVSGRSAELSSPADKKIFALGRDLADVILVGAGTANAEGYRGVKPTETRQDRRQRFGLSPIPPIAVVTATGSVAPDSPLLTDTLVPPLVLTCGAAPAGRLADLRAAGAEVIVTGADDVDLATALTALDERGLRRIDCEGGPRLFGSLITADLVDELRLTVSPLLAGGTAGRIAVGVPPEVPLRLRLVSAIHAGDFLLLRYERDVRKRIS